MQVPPQSHVPPQVRPPQGSDNTVRNVLIGCGCLSLLAAGAFGLFVYFVISGATKLVTNVGASVAVNSATSAIRNSRLPEDQKKRFLDRIEQVEKEMVEGKHEFGKTSAFADKIGESPLLPAATMDYIDEQYLKKSGLTDEEKASGKKTLARIVHGLVQGDFDKNDVDDLLEPLASPVRENEEHVPSNTERLKKKVTDEELRTFLTDASELANDNKVPEAPPAINIPEEFNKVIDKAMEELRKK